MKSKNQTSAICLLVTSSLIASCGRGQLPEVTPIPTSAPTPTLAATAIPVVRAGIGIYVESTVTYLSSSDFAELAQAIPAEWFASPKGLPRYEIGIKPTGTEVQVCQYTGAFGAVSRVQVDVDVSVTDLEDHTLIGTNHFTGALPIPCPSTISRGVIFGLPRPHEFKRWLLNTLPPDARLPATPGEPTVVELARAQVYSLAFSPDGQALASLTDGSYIVKLWNVVSGERLLTSSTIYAINFAFSPDGKTLASALGGPTVKLWDVASGKELLTSEMAEPEPYIVYATFSPDGKMLASALGSSTVKLWDVASGKELLTLRWNESEVTSFAFSPDGKMLAVAGYNGTVKLWDVASAKELLTLSEQTSSQYDNFSVAFSPDGKTLASALGGSTVKLWDVANGKELLTLNGEEPLTVNGLPFSGYVSVAFSPDGKMLASGSDNQTITLWDVASGKELLTLSGQTSSGFYSVAFSPDGKILASGSGDGKVKLWDVITGEILFEFTHTPW